MANRIYTFLIILVLSSCANTKDFIYFQPKENDTTTIISTENVSNYNTILKADDIISISVSAIDPELVKPFNQGTVATAAGKTETSNVTQYLIDAKGNIEFPVLGTLAMAGLTRIEAANLIKERVKNYVTNPIVNVRLQNFKITILGDVRTPGVYTLNHDRVTLPEALGLAGDLNITGVRKNVLVIREEAGVKTETRIDLTSRNVFQSPVYYLHQNDIIYIEPSKSKVNSTTQVGVYTSIGVAGVSLIIGILNILTR